MAVTTEESTNNTNGTNGRKDMEIMFKDESYAVMGACFDVYNQLGAGFLEPVYQESLAIELTLRQIPFKPQVPLDLRYKGRRLEQKYIADFLVYGAIVLEIKALAGITGVHRGQVLNYLKATGYRLGLLVNFGSSPRVEYERILL
jgi:GxxExxY protein